MRNLYQRIRDSYQYARLRFFFQPFYFGGHWIKYLAHRYNATWRNERAFEVPLVWGLLAAFKEKNSDAQVLEIGNVLSHYYPINHIVVDKYEKSVGVINEDILEFKSDKKFDAIIAISTIEHIGWHEDVVDPLKTLRVVKKLKGMLNPGGMLLVTIPHGVNPFLDYLLRVRIVAVGMHHYFKRTSSLNTWSRCSRSDFLNSKYGFPFGNANSICLGIYKKESK